MANTNTAVTYDGVITDTLFGTRVLSITAPGTGGTAKSYVAESWNPHYPTTKVVSKDNKNIPNGQAIIPDLPSATATVQFPTDGTAAVVGATTTIDTEVWIVDDVSTPEEQGGVKKQTLTFSRKIASA
jgi:hypothetical protein